MHETNEICQKSTVSSNLLDFGEFHLFQISSIYLTKNKKFQLLLSIVFLFIDLRLLECYANAIMI